MSPHKPVIGSIDITELHPGDLLHVRVGVADLGDGMGPWIPSEQELDEVRAEFEAVLLNNKVIVTHLGVKIEDVVRSKS